MVDWTATLARAQAIEAMKTAVQHMREAVAAMLATQARYGTVR